MAESKTFADFFLKCCSEKTEVGLLLASGFKIAGTIDEVNADYLMLLSKLSGKHWTIRIESVVAVSVGEATEEFQSFGAGHPPRDPPVDNHA
jgi:sRNA-binding regulator protein Hfq